MNQTYTDIEILVVDDCSTDQSALVVHELEVMDSRIHYYCSESNVGVIKTANFGISKSRGEYIIVLGNDDILDKKHVEIGLQKIKKKAYSYLYFSSNLIDENGEIFGERAAEDVTDNYSLFARKNPINACGAMINANYLKKLGGFPEKLGFKNCGEWYLWIELLHFEKCAYVKDVRSYYRIHSNNLTKKLFSKENLRSTKEYSSLCMKEALKLDGITFFDKMKYKIFRILYILKMNIKMFTV